MHPRYSHLRAAFRTTKDQYGNEIDANGRQVDRQEKVTELFLEV
jgi:hypothetical protein